ncbi:MAG: 2-succinyl-5-enolpyruvyl-6-hydroxy-3-cyclohexene-1-carboxylic-acid synthase [Actinobacteria bacterium]|nr:2-succinyl-5-enolpyruvyl-6-hydroxy-3-cyclohexene-1-carboxylic-acid synthase [Actinomycetota bacterium]
MTESPAVNCAAALVGALVRSGVRDFVLSPGSRSAPLALAVGRAELAGELSLHVIVDERAAGYFAIGLMRAGQRPVAVICTSGTAVANLHPAMVEASYSALPLILLTADRPIESRGVGSPQTIEQDDIFGPDARTMWDVPAPEYGDEAERAEWAALGVRAAADASRLAGPVHLNLAFRAPLVGPPPEQERIEVELASINSDAEDAEPVATPPGTGLLLVGDLPPRARRFRVDILALAERLGWPIIAEPSAGLPPHANLVSHGPLLAGAEDWLEAHTPDLVLSIGRFGLSRSVNLLVQRTPLHWSVAVDDRFDAPDHLGTAERILTRIPVAGTRAVADWLAGWRAADEVAEAALGAVIADGPRRSGIAVTRQLWHLLRPSDTVLLAASWPMRFVDSFASTPQTQHVHANRGANGIDGLVATTAGLARGRGTHVVGLLGDLALWHDIGSLPRLHGMRTTLVVLDNDGGGIFSQLEQAAPAYQDVYERVFGTPGQGDLAAAVSGFGIEVAQPQTALEFADAYQGAAGQPRVLIVPTLPRSAEAALAVKLQEHVAAALAG